MIYFDNSATTRHKPFETIKNMILGVTRFSANPGRSGHTPSYETLIAITSVREQVRAFVGCSRMENVIYTQNCTDALNLAILGTAKYGGHVICTENEHNSVMRPLTYLKNNNKITYSVARVNNEGRINADNIRKLIQNNTYLIITNHISNVNGDQAIIGEIGELARKNNILYLVDGAQSAGHKKIDMIKDNIDMLALAGHKTLLGPQGIGVLCFENRAQINPIRFGGTGTNSIELTQPKVSPECYESGTIATPNILGLGGGISYVSEHFEEICEKIEILTKYALNKLKDIKNIKIYTNPNNLNGVVAFNIGATDSMLIADYLNSKNICVRAGLHCAPIKHKALDTLNQGIVRISFTHNNTTCEIDELINCLNEF